MKAPSTPITYFDEDTTAERHAVAAGYAAGYDGLPRTPPAGTIKPAWLEGYDRAANATKRTDAAGRDVTGLYGLHDESDAEREPK